MSRRAVFISYSHADWEWKDRVLRQLKALQMDVDLLWVDDRIQTGDDWQSKINEGLERATIAITLISADFLGSEFVKTEEVPKLLKGRNERGLRIFPVMLSPCGWETTDWLRSIQHRPKNKYLSEMQKIDYEKELSHLAKEIYDALDQSEPPRENSPVAVHTDPLSKPPSRWWAAIKGWLDYRRAREMRTFLSESYLNKDIGQNLQRSLKAGVNEFSIEFETWRSRPQSIHSLPLATVIIGPAGVGKSRFLGELFKQHVSQIELVAELAPDDIELVLQRKDPAVLWQRIFRYFWAQTKAGLRPLTREAVAYALNTRRVLLLVEDLHSAGSVGDIFPRLREYFETYHRWSSHLKMFLTTRESLTDDQKSKLGPDIQIVRLEPLRDLEAQEFFFALCRKNGVDLNVSEIGETLSKAFATETTRTPLFVVICAWLTVTANEHRRHVGRLLQMEASRIFDTFIDELFTRASDKRIARESFRATYQQIALKLWPEWRNISDNKIEEDSHPLGRAFLEKNGFLFRSQTSGSFGATKLSFPHQSMADYLAAKAMVEAKCFSLLCDNNTPTRLEGLIEFFSELIVDNGTLLALAEDELSVFVKCIKYNPTILNRPGMGEWTQLVEAIVGKTEMWATRKSKRRQDVQIWQQLRDLLDERTLRWRELLCTRLEKEGASVQGIEALAAIGGDKCVKLLNQWLETHSHLFTNAMNVKPVQEYLLQKMTIDGIATTEGWLSFCLVWKSDDPELRPVAEQKLKDAIRNTYLGDDKVGRLVELGRSAIRTLALASKDSPLSIKQRISSVVSQKLGKALVPPGQYQVRADDGQAQTVRIQTPILVPCMSETLRGSFTQREAIDRVTRTVDVDKLMTSHQGKVVSRYFCHNPAAGRWGVVFPEPNAAYTEAWRISRTKAGLFVFSDPTKIDLQVRAVNTEPVHTAISSVAYREVENA